MVWYISRMNAHFLIVIIIIIVVVVVRQEKKIGPIVLWWNDTYSYSCWLIFDFLIDRRAKVWADTQIRYILIYITSYLSQIISLIKVLSRKVE